MPVFAAIDIGSNSVRLSIAELRSSKLIALHQDREVTRLGEGVFRNGALEPQAMTQTIKVLRRFRKAIQRFGAEKTRVVATSAVRDAKNSRVFADLVLATTGWRLEVITGLEEGRLIHLGVVGKLRARSRRLLLIDLGGGSCELTLSVNGHIQHMVSLPLGAVRLTQDFLRRDPPTSKEIARMHEFIREELSRVKRNVLSTKRLDMTIATSGTAAALAEAARERTARAAGVTTRSQVVQLAGRLSESTRVERQALPGINAKRAEIIVAGAAVYSEIMTGLGLSNFRYSPLGLRDGILAQMAAEHDIRSQSHKQIESDRSDALMSMCKRYEVDVANSDHIRKLAISVFKGLGKVHLLPKEYSDWISAAAMLHEVGLYINRTGRYRHTYYVVNHSELFGYTPEQRTLIAVIARYQGGSKPQWNDRILRQLPPSESSEAIKAIALLRIAKALNHGRRRAVRSLRTQIRSGEVHLKLQVGRSGADLELWAAEREASHFLEVFGRELSIDIL